MNLLLGIKPQNILKLTLDFVNKKTEMIAGM